MNIRRLSLALLLPAIAAAPAAAQHDPAADHQHHSSYASQEMTDVASLSRREMDDLVAGAGMGLARAAELNNHPGPKHVLELAAELGLDEEQRSAVERARAAVLAEAQRLGAQIVELERHLNRRFEHRHIDEEILRQATAEISGLEGELRFVHLRAHLETREILSAEQIADYDRLRGYDGAQDETPGPEAAAREQPLARAQEAAALEQSLAAAERAFAAAATRRDRDAFLSFITPATVFATPHGNLLGPDAIFEQWVGFFAPGGPAIGWEPERVAVAGDGTIGLTSGPYWVEMPAAPEPGAADAADTAGDGTVRLGGTFFSVWRRDAGGEWKILLDCGTEPEPATATPAA